MSVNKPILLLISLFNQVMETIFLEIMRRGWNLTKSQVMVAMLVREGITRPSQIAVSLNVSRQAVHQTIGELVTKGFLTTVDDAGDRRAKVVSFTEAGKRLAEDLAHALRAVDADLQPLKFGAAA